MVIFSYNEKLFVRWNCSRWKLTSFLQECCNKLFLILTTQQRLYMCCAASQLFLGVKYSIRQIMPKKGQHFCPLWLMKSHILYFGFNWINVGMILLLSFSPIFKLRAVPIFWDIFMLLIISSAHVKLWIIVRRKKHKFNCWDKHGLSWVDDTQGFFPTKIRILVYYACIVTGC